ALQETTNAPRDGVRQVVQLGTCRRLHPTKLRAQSIRDIDVDTSGSAPELISDKWTPMSDMHASDSKQ
ncbi:MAG: hypothetical protein ACI8P9_005392, partial [Parasphingorhabdus sp.]